MGCGLLFICAFAGWVLAGLILFNCVCFVCCGGYGYVVFDSLSIGLSCVVCRFRCRFMFVWV